MFDFLGNYLKAKMLNYFLGGVIVLILIAVFIGNPISLVKDFKLPEVSTKTEKQANNKKANHKKNISSKKTKNHNKNKKQKKDQSN